MDLIRIKAFHGIPLRMLAYLLGYAGPKRLQFSVRMIKNVKLSGGLIIGP